MLSSLLHTVRHKSSDWCHKSPLLLYPHACCQSCSTSCAFFELQRRLMPRAGGKILLNNARLWLKRGRRYGLCGPNGCGKSTLMRAIANGQLEGFPPKEELRTVYVEHDIDASQAETPVVEFVYSDPNLQGAHRHCSTLQSAQDALTIDFRALVRQRELVCWCCRRNASSTRNGGGDTCFGWLFSGDAGGARGLTVGRLEDEARAGCDTCL